MARRSHLLNQSLYLSYNWKGGRTLLLNVMKLNARVERCILTVVFVLEKIYWLKKVGQSRLKLPDNIEINELETLFVGSKNSSVGLDCGKNYKTLEILG